MIAVTSLSDSWWIFFSLEVESRHWIAKTLWSQMNLLQCVLLAWRYFRANLVRIVMITTTKGSKLCDPQTLFCEFLTYLSYIPPDVVAAYPVYLLMQGGSLLNSSVSCGSRNQVSSRSSFMDWWQGWKFDDWRIQGRELIGNKRYYSNRLKGSTWPPCKQSLFSFLIFWVERRHKTYVP